MDPFADSRKKPVWARWWFITLVATAIALVLIPVLAGDDEADDDSTLTPPATRPVADDEQASDPAEDVAAPDEDASGEEPADPGNQPADPGDTPADPGEAAADPSDPPADSSGEPIDRPTPDEPPTAAGGDSVAGAPDGQRGDRSNPVPAGVIADVGDGWRLQVLDVVDDATALVLDENMFNDPPPDGGRFTLVTVALGYFGRNDPVSPLMTSISAVGSANRELTSNCGVIPVALPFFEDFFAGGVATGNVCFVTEPDDAGALQLYAQTGFSGDQVFLDVAAATAQTEVMSPLRGVNDGSASAEARRSPIAVGEAADMGDDWTFQVTSPAIDITDAVLAENMFNAPPEAGFRFIGVGAEYSYSGEGSANAFMVIVNAVGDSNVQLSQSCGVTPDDVELFTDVFGGGSTAGTLCFVVPEEDVGSIVLYGAAGFGRDARFFATE